MNLSQQEFDSLIIDVNEALSRDNKPIASRPINAVINICQKLDVSAPLATPSFNDVTFPVTQVNLNHHVDKWYKERYGDALKVDFSQASFPINLEGQIFKCKVPLFFGSVLVAASKNKLDENVLNPVDHIEGLPDFVRDNISSDEMSQLQWMMQICIGVSQKLNSLHDNLPQSARDDIGTSCELLLGMNPKSSLSAWHSLQATEKLLKYFISFKEEPKFTHDIHKLKNKAISLGYVPDDNIKWDVFMFGPSVRYEPDAIQADSAIEINQETWRVAWNILYQVNQQ